MARLTPAQQALRERVEGAIAIAAPFLDAVLAVGDRISRIAEPADHDYYPIRPGERATLPGEAEPGAGGAGSGERAADPPARRGPPGKP